MSVKPKGTNLVITMMMTLTNNVGQAQKHQPAVACPGMVRPDGTNQDMMFFLPSALGQEFYASMDLSPNQCMDQACPAERGSELLANWTCS